MNAQPAQERSWENPWFMAAFFCAAMALGLLWQSVQIDAETDRLVEQLVDPAALVGV